MCVAAHVNAKRIGASKFPSAHRALVFVDIVMDHRMVVHLMFGLESNWLDFVDEKHFHSESYSNKGIKEQNCEHQFNVPFIALAALERPEI